MLAVIRYLSDLLVGAFLYLAVATVMSVAAGFDFLALVLLVLPLVLGGFVSGLNFFYPRIASIIALVFVLPFFIIGFVDSIKGPIGYDPWTIVIPAAAVIVPSLLSLSFAKSSLWSRLGKVGKLVIAILTAIPALLAIWCLIYLVLFIGGIQPPAAR